MKIITTALEGKGGIGASATAVNLYLELSKTKKVLMIDLDENKHTTKFFIARNDKSNKVLNVETDNELQKIMEDEDTMKFDFIILDSGKYISDLNDYALQISDLVIVPTSKSDSDYIQAQQFIEKIQKEVISNNDYTEVKMLVNRVHPNATLFHKEMTKVYESESRVSVFETIIAQDPAYELMSLSGKGVYELTKKPRALSDIKRLALEVIGK